MNSKYYAISENPIPLRIRRSNYEDETQLESIVCQHPSLMSKHPRIRETIIFVGRQIDLGGIYMDALFVNENGVPIITEFKLAKNPEIKRDIISQILQYAFSASDVLTADRLRTMFRDNNKQNSETLERFDNADFWETAAKHLKCSHYYLAGVADDFSGKTMEYFESIDKQMPNQSWYCVELTPHRVDQTNELIIERSVQAPVHPFDDFENIAQWNFVTTVNHIRNGNIKIVPLLQRVLTWLMEAFPQSHFGKGDHYISFNVYTEQNGKLATLYVGRESSEIEVPRWTFSQQALASVECEKLEDFICDATISSIGKSGMIASTNQYIKLDLAELSEPQVYAWFQNKVKELANLATH